MTAKKKGPARINMQSPNAKTTDANIIPADIQNHPLANMGGSHVE
jgi:hypothetical protein